MHRKEKGVFLAKAWNLLLLVLLSNVIFSQRIEIPKEWVFYRVGHKMVLDSAKAMYLDRTFEKLADATFAAFAPGRDYGYVVVSPGRRIENVLEVVEGYKPAFKFEGAEKLDASSEDVLRLYFWRAGKFDESRWLSEKIRPIYYGVDKEKWNVLYQKVLEISSKK
jgi:hypothetical protein